MSRSIDSAVPTLERFLIDTFWPEKSCLSSTTLKLYHDYCDRFILPFFDNGRTLLDEIDHHSIQLLINDCRTFSIAHKCKETLSTILGYAVEPCHLLDYNPALGRYHYPDVSTSVSKMGTILYTFRDLVSFMDAIHDAIPGRMLDIAITVDSCLGLRPGELAGLNENSFDFDNNKILIGNSYSNFSNTHVFKGIKTGQSRVLPLFDYLKEKLIAFGVDPENPSPLFVDTKGERIKEGEIRKRLLYYRSKLNLSPVTLQSIRHSFIITLLLAGFPLQVVQEWVGHSDPRTTLGYLQQLSFQILTDASRRLDSLYRNPPDAVLFQANGQLPATNQELAQVLESQRSDLIVTALRSALNAKPADTGQVVQAQAEYHTPVYKEVHEQDILKLISDDPRISYDTMAYRLSAKKCAVIRTVKHLRQRGLLDHEGSSRGGCWKLVAS